MASKFKEIPLEDRPREKLKKYGAGYLSDQELLAIILRCGTKNMSVMELASFILNKYHSLYSLTNCSYDELIEISGIKDSKAIEILSLMEFAKRIQVGKIKKLAVANSPDIIYENFSVFLKNKQQENFMVIYLNIKSHIIKYETLFVGGINFSIIDVNLILKRCIEYGACKIICMHNHPSGDPTPSNQDIMLTKKISQIADLLDIKLIDHIIVGLNDYCSLKQEGYF